MLSAAGIQKSQTFSVNAGEDGAPGTEKEMTVDDIMKEVGYTRTSVCKWIARGKLKAEKVNGYWFITRRDWQQFRDEQALDGMTVLEVARKVNRTGGCVWLWINRGKLKATRSVGRFYRIRQKDLDTFIREVEYDEDFGIYDPDELIEYYY